MFDLTRHQGGLVGRSVYSVALLAKTLHQRENSRLVEDATFVVRGAGIGGAIYYDVDYTLSRWSYSMGPVLKSNT